MDTPHTQLQNPKKKSKWALGCGIGCAVIIVLVIGGSIGGYFYVKGKLKAVTSEFTKLGFQAKEMAQIIDERDPISKKTLYIGQVVKIFSDSSTDIAIVAQTAEIHGKINGNVYFRGQVLTILPKGEVTGDVDVWAQVVKNQGKIGGQVKGTYQVLNTD